jgi:hypothetical protein
VLQLGGGGVVSFRDLAKNKKVNSWNFDYKVRVINKIFAADPEFLKRYVSSSRVLKGAVEQHYASTPSAVVHLLRETSVGHQILRIFGVPLDHALYNKDITRVADLAYTIFFSASGLSGVAEYPRLFSVQAARVALNAAVKSIGGIKVEHGAGFEKPRVVSSVRLMLLLMIYKYLAEGNSIESLLAIQLLIKLAWDGADMGSRKYLSFCISSIFGLLARVQSPRNVHTIGIAFVEESMHSIQHLIPDLGEQIRELEANGIFVPSPHGGAPYHIRLHFGVGLDYSSVTKSLPLIGSVGAEKFCFACNATKQNRNDIGMFGCIALSFIAFPIFTNTNNKHGLFRLRRQPYV